MAREVVCYVLFRILLPLVQLAATVVRFNGFSLLYGCLLLVGPLLPRPTKTSMKGHTGRYLLATLILCSLTLLAQVVFQSYLLIVANESQPYGTILTNCSTLESALRQVGLQRLEPNDFINIIRVILPDVGMFAIAILVFVTCYCLLQRQSGDSSEQTSGSPEVHQCASNNDSTLANFVGEFFLALFLVLAGIAYPSALSSLYVLVFIAMGLWWGCYRHLGQKFAIVRIILLVYTSAHLITVYLYQFQFFQEAVPIGKDEFAARVLGLTGIVKTDCRKPWNFYFHSDLKWTVFASPAAILGLYIVLACEVRRWASKPNGVKVKQVLDEKQQTMSTSLSEPSSPRSRDATAGSERQVDTTPHEQSNNGKSKAQDIEGQALMDETHTSYHTMEQAETASIVPEAGVYGETMQSPQLSVPPGEVDALRSKMVSVLVFIMKHSYAATLIVMMVWAITYHSWLTFVFLLSACIIWVIPQKRTICLCLSPVIVLYAVGLVVILYVYNLDVPNLPTETPSHYKYNQIGLVHYDYPCLHLGIQIFFTSIFLLTLRQFMRERVMHQRDQYMQGLALVQVEGASSSNLRQTTNLRSPLDLVDYVDGYDGETIKAVGSWMWHICCKYWIFVCAAMFLVMAIQEAVIYRFIYMMAFLYFVTAFQVFYRWWRFTLQIFWWIVIIYSMLVLCFLYTYQFDAFPDYWKAILSTKWIAALGLETFDTATLFVKLLTPTSFLIVIIIQLHYFHHNFLYLSDINRFKLSGDNIVPNTEGVDTGVATTEGDQQAATETDGLATDTGTPVTVEEEFKACKKKYTWSERFHQGAHTAYRFLEVVSSLVWRLLEIHMIKISMITIVVCSIVEVSCVNLVLVVLVLALLPLRPLHRFMSHACLFWAGLVMLAKMVFQLELVTDTLGAVNCTDVQNVDANMTLPYPWNDTIHISKYIGFEKTSELGNYLKNYIVIVLILALESITYIHQQQQYNKPNKTKPIFGIVYPEIRRPDGDKGLIQCAKFFVNYTFYKYGMEICFVMTIITMAVRLDIYSVLYGVFLGIFLFIRRYRCYVLWPVYTVILLILLLVQYLACLGVPPAICWGYPWDMLTHLNLNLKIFLYLPSFTEPPNPSKLIADFFQVLFVCLQWRVFRIENNKEELEAFGGGDNKEVVQKVENKEPNPTEDFMSYKNNYLDYLKVLVFHYAFWFTLLIVFITGTTRISLFCMGYLVGCFFFFWFGNELLVKPLRKLIKLWTFLLGYNYFVILSKCCLQLVGCVYLTNLTKRFCWLIQLLSIVCLNSGDYNLENPDQLDTKCSIDEDESGLAWDITCFVFLIIQLRIFRSYYFQHVVMELDIQDILSARGAELINTQLIQQVADQKEQEKITLDGIRRKMERIRLRQERLQIKLEEDTDHYTVIRSGDYYMFADDSDDDDDTTSVDTKLDDVPTDDIDEELGPLQLINTAFRSGTEEALRKVERRTSRDGQVFEPEASPSAPSSPAIQEDCAEAFIPDSDDVDEGHSGDAAAAEAPKKESLWKRICNSLKLTWAVIGGLLDQAIMTLHSISREYRSVSKVLEKEEAQEKARRREKQRNVVPSTSGQDVAEGDDDTRPLTLYGEVNQSRAVAVQMDSDEERLKEFEESLDEMREKEEHFQSTMPKILQLFVAMLEVLMSRSEFVCYFAMILNHLLSASILSLMYPLSVFLWAMLSVPRPSKTYWITIITYTEAVVVVKYLFQFGFFPWNDGSIHEDPFWPPRIIGIEKKNNFAAFDILLLFCLFIHRSVLKKHGLWKDAVDIHADIKKVEDQVGTTNSSPVSSPTHKSPSHLESAETSLRAIEASCDSTTSGEKEPPEKEGPITLVCKPFTEFYQQMTNPDYNAVTDVYAAMFLCDFLAILITVFGYWGFGPAGTKDAAAGAVSSVISDNKVPVPFLIMLLVQFLLIIVDRALYLRKNIAGKFLFQVILLIVVHVWLFFLLPPITRRLFADNTPAQLWYFTKCVYFALSAYQIRCGYPTCILGNFLTKKYNMLNKILFKGFLLIPFLLELRAIMDWMWIDTTLALTAWLQMEDIYANIFDLKCSRNFEKKYPTPRGTQRKALVKFGMGGGLLFILIFIIWFPLLLFSLAGTVFEANPPVDCTVSIRIGGYQPIFHVSAQQQFVQEIPSAEYDLLKDKFSTDLTATLFLNSYKSEDVYIIKINGQSTSTWGISPPSQEALRRDLDSQNPINLYFTISFTREPHEGSTSDTVSTEITKNLDPFNAADHKLRSDLAKMMNGTYNGTALIKEVFPQYMLVPGSDKPVAADVMMRAENLSYTDIQARLVQADDTSWWQLKEVPQKSFIKNDTSYLTVVTFNQRVAPKVLSFFAGYGIMGLYLSLVLVVGKFVRLFVSDLTYKIMYQELPCVDKILKLCLRIYLVRENREFKLEEELFARLLFLYRSPETLIRFTKPKQD